MIEHVEYISTSSLMLRTTESSVLYTGNKNSRPPNRSAALVFFRDVIPEVPG